MAIHAGADVAIGGILLGKDVVDASLDVFRVGAVVWVLAVGEKGDGRESDHAGLIAPRVFPAAFLGLFGGKKAQAALIHLLHLGGDIVILPARQILREC